MREPIFRGRFESKLDPKGRLLIPAAFRDQLPVEDCTLVVTNSQFQSRRCLDAYPLAEWEALEKKIHRLSQLKSEVQAFQRFYLSSGQLITADAQNRIVIPASLRAYAHLEADIQLVGMGKKIEVWSQSVWSSLFEGLAETFETNLAAIAALEES